MNNWKPIFIENSKIPIWLSKFAPIEIEAITLGFFVISKNEMNEVLRNHETIHFQQYLETGFIGFVFIYLYDWLLTLKNTGDPIQAYYGIRAELEAYEHQNDLEYLSKRKRYEWLQSNG